MNLLLIDDDEAVANGMIRQIKEFCDIQSLHYEQGYDNIESVLDNKNIDVILSDIRIGNTLAFDYLDNLTSPLKEIPIIFISAYHDYARYSIKYRPYEYLLKPLDVDSLNDVLNNITTRSEQQSHISKEIIGFSTNKGVRFVKINEIQYLSADSNYTEVHLTNDRKILISKSLGKVESELGIHDFFIRVGRSNIINLLYVKEYKAGKKNQVIMKDGKAISVSIRQRQQLKNLFNII